MMRSMSVFIGVYFHKNIVLSQQVSKAGGIHHPGHGYVMARDTLARERIRPLPYLPCALEGGSRGQCQ